MNKYSPIKSYLTNSVTTVIVLGVFLLNNNLGIFKTSILTGFFFLIKIRNSYQRDNLYNFIHNKTINI